MSKQKIMRFDITGKQVYSKLEEMLNKGCTIDHILTTAGNTYLVIYREPITEE